ncbi:MAG: RluA family pseudouridine synthase [Bacilli bacterium]
MKEYLINKSDSNQTLEKYIRKVLYFVPLSFIYKLFRKKDIKVNHRWENKNYIVIENDVISIYIKDEDFDLFKSNKENKKYQKLDEISNLIIYEDNNILIINKPQGLLVQPDSSFAKSLDEMVINYLYFKNEIDPINNVVTGVGPAHRIDRNTSGIVIFGKNISSLHLLMDYMKDKDKIEKYYLAIVKGVTEKQGEINAPILKIEKNNHVVVDFDNKDSKPALTKYKLIKSFNNYSLVEFRLLTGRTHQIRIHSSYISHPIIGDNKYGDFILNKEFKSKYDINNQLLHSYKIKFNKLDGVLSYLSNREFIADLPDNFIKVINEEEK